MRGSFKRDIKHLDDARFVETAQFALEHTALGSGLWERFKVMLSSLRSTELETRIITTADIFARPYRDAVPIPRTLEIMAETVGSALDPACFAALERVVPTLEPHHSRPPSRTRAA